MAEKPQIARATITLSYEMDNGESHTQTFEAEPSSLSVSHYRSVFKEYGLDGRVSNLKPAQDTVFVIHGRTPELRG